MLLLVVKLFSWLVEGTVVGRSKLFKKNTGAAARVVVDGRGYWTGGSAGFEAASCKRRSGSRGRLVMGAGYWSLMTSVVAKRCCRHDEAGNHPLWLGAGGQLWGGHRPKSLADAHPAFDWRRVNEEADFFAIHGIDAAVAVVVVGQH